MQDIKPPPVQSKIYPWRDGIMLGGMVLLITVLCNSLMYYYASKGMLKEIQDTLFHVTRTAAVMTNGDLHQTLKDPTQKDSEDYLLVQKPYREILSVNPNIRYIYTVIERDEKAYFIIDTQQKATHEEQDGERKSTAEVMELYSEIPPTMQEALRNKKELAENEPYSDEWGTFISAYVPIYDSNHEYIGIVGADIDATDYIARMNAVRLPYIVSIILSVILSVGVMLVIRWIRQGHSDRWVARQQQLETLKAFQQHIQEVSNDMSDISFKIDGKTAQIAGMAKTSAEKMLTARSVIQGSTDKYQSISDATVQLMGVIQTLSQVIAGHTQSAIDGMEMMKETKHSSQELMDATRNISNVTAIINEITERTELLALNASIEAARAGAAGKGFAVVADEVKMLASQTKQSTEQIVKYIDAMKRAAESTVNSVDSSKDFITKIDELSQKTQAMILEQKDMIGYITDDIKDVTQRTSVINEMVDAISVIAENISGQTGTMHQAVHSLHEQNTVLSEKVSRFIKTM